MKSVAGLLSRVGRRADGDAHESIALAFLERNGLSLVTRNWQCKQGEIDLVMRDAATLIFVEVRKRQSAEFGGAAASIDSSKSKRVERAVNAYLGALPARPDFRIDAVVFDGGNRTPQWVKNVFA
jgi:putative endonuclease